MVWGLLYGMGGVVWVLQLVVDEILFVFVVVFFELFFFVSVRVD